MPRFLFWSRLLGVLSLTTIASVLIFQNCAKVQFSGVEKTSLVSDDYEPVVADADTDTDTEVSNGPANGDGYEGKVSYYIRWSIPGECDSEISIVESEIEKEGEVFRKTIANCRDIVPVELDPNLVTLVDTGLVYDGDEYVVSFPESCAMIYENGGDNPNGLYWLDHDGEGPEEPELQYCNMVLIAQGWSAWGEWGECNVSCGIGEQQRERSCVAGGCSGSATQIRECQRPACP